MSAGLFSSIRPWVLATRPKTLFASVTPVLLGTALAFSESSGNLPAALAALIGALCIQIATNLANDYWDAKKGADTGERLGPVRVTASGLLKPRAVFAGMVVFFALATLAGLFLVIRAGWPVVAIGVLSIAFGILYTAGPFSLAYNGLGDVFSFLFFGLVATAGTFYVQTLELSNTALLLGCIPGCYSVVLLALNNLRDRESDERAGKKTLAVRFGRRFAVVEVIVLLFLPALVPFWVLPFNEGGWLCAFGGFLGGLRIAAPLAKIRDLRQINDLFPHVAAVSVMMAVLISVFLLL